MPQGYYTIEQWISGGKGEAPQWRPIMHLPFGLSQTAAEDALQKQGKAGLFRLVQMQRLIWAEQEPGGLRLRKSHAGSPESLDRQREMFERCGGKYPVEEVKAARRKVKSKAKKAK
jgi:hypothetical protein